MTNQWIPTETPILESVFVDLCPNGEVYVMNRHMPDEYVRYNLDTWQDN